MNQDTNPIAIGLMSGAVFCLLLALFSRVGVLVLIPVMLGALPIYIATLGWGSKAGLVAGLVVAGFTLISADPSTALLISMTILAPAILAGFQANLAQPSTDEGAEMIWFPLSRILFWTTLLIAAAVLVFGLMLDFDPEQLGPLIAKDLQSKMPNVQNDANLSIENLADANIVVLSVMPFIMPSVWIGIHWINLLWALRITRGMGVLARPREDIAANLNLPKAALIFMVIALIGTMMASEPLTYIFAVGAGAFAMAFSVVGLGTMHHAIRDWKIGRPQVLFLIYTLIIIFFIPIYLFSYAGILKTARGTQT